MNVEVQIKVGRQHARQERIGLGAQSGRVGRPGWL
jgi:hypothetical protein